MHCQRNIYQSRTLDLLRNCLSDGQDGGCKQRGQTATIWLKALLMPRLAVCSRDLHWHWINWTLLCDTMEVSMLRLAWLPIACSMCSSPYVGRTVPLLKPPQSPHCYLGEVDHAKISPHPWPHGKPGLIALIGPLRPYCSQSPLILFRCVTEIKFAQNLRWLGNWH